MRFWSSKNDNAICYSKDLKHFIIKEIRMLIIYWSLVLMSINT